MSVRLWTLGPHNIIADPLDFIRRHLGIPREHLFVHVSGPYCNHDNFGWGWFCNESEPILDNFDGNWMKFPFKAFPWFIRDAVWHMYGVNACQTRSCRALRRADALLCSFPPRLCELLLPLGKPLLVLPLQSADWGAVGSVWPKVLSALGAISGTKVAPVRQRRPKTPFIVASYSDFAQEYLRHQFHIEPFSGIEVLATHALGEAYQPSRTASFLLGPPGIRRQTEYQPVLLNLEAVLIEMQSRFGIRVDISMPSRESADGDSSGGGFTRLSDLGTYRAAIMLPYAPFSYFFAEAYAVGVPMFFPTVDLLLLWQTNFRVCTEWFHPYMNGSFPVAPGSPWEVVISPTSPGARRWIKLAWYYRTPHIFYFESITDLLLRLAQASPEALAVVSGKMKAEVSRRIPEVKASWENVLGKLGVEASVTKRKRRRYDNEGLDLHARMKHVYGERLGSYVQRLLNGAHKPWSSTPRESRCMSQLSEAIPARLQQLELLGMCCDREYGQDGHSLCFGSNHSVLAGSTRDGCCDAA
eukprot:TRINITY_DN24026_c0_g1_i2.p1 TRINITY_DN24026_c0_g1~~TRINITY_DN24026_c0_g1_i2.p1  ORF type:complete len:527 (+),score=49.35 TRINITY_DN24026_c0_g1_i2:124-1704(+)